MNHTFYTRYLQVVSVFFALFGTFWAVTGTFDPFGLYEKYFAISFWGSQDLPADAEITFRFLLGPIGATCAGYFLMQYFIATYAYAKKERWGYFAVVIPFSLWFLLDTAICIYLGAYFNIYLANIPSLIAMAPVFFSYKYFSRPG